GTQGNIEPLRAQAQGQRQEDQEEGLHLLQEQRR
ncbi:MAG: hypothetical protein AVDCRST_MAG20-1401, partial [uncultured Acidimicrobiales bacterium]